MVAHRPLTHVAPHTYVVLVEGGPSPLLAVLGSGLDLLADLPVRTRVVAARSFVGGSPWDDRAGVGTAAAILLAERLRPAWGPGGAAEVRLLIAKVSGPDGVPQGVATASALRWARSVALDLGGDAPRIAPGLTRALAERGVVVLPVPSVGLRAA